MRNIPTITRNLLIINVLVFLITVLVGGTTYQGGTDYTLNSQFGLYFFLAPNFHVYQLVTYMFMHGGWDHLFFNMFALWMFGCVVERVWGAKKFLFYYISCGIGAGLFQEMAQFADYMGLFGQATVNLGTTVGASGAIYAILLAFGMIFPEERIFIFPLPVPIKAKWFVIIYAAIELFSALSTTGDGVAHLAHLGGMVFGFFMIRYWQKHPGGSQRFGRSYGQEFFDNLKRKYDERQRNQRMQAEQTRWEERRRETDEEYNERQRKNQEEIDAILDKIRKSGYDSLTSEEKRKLFEQSKK